MRALTKKESLAAAICVLTLGSAIVAGFSFGDSTNVVVNRIIGFSSAASGTLDGLSNLLGVSFGFAAGMMATVNPCGFVMLPVVDRNGEKTARRILLYTLLLLGVSLLPTLRLWRRRARRAHR